MDGQVGVGDVAQRSDGRSVDRQGEEVLQLAGVAGGDHHAVHQPARYEDPVGKNCLLAVMYMTVPDVT